MSSYNCARCGAANSPSAYLLQKSQLKPTPDHCIRCGASHSLHAGSVEVISPVMRPLPDDPLPWRASPWMLPRYRPALVGLYECRFRELEPRILVLQWTGKCFAIDGREVNCRTLMGWRGEWANG